ncbi:hypothetical protein A4E84_02275 [Streptomyces qaidamensis]|uniref:Uncharacterized protein n=1 Tax=Streptomyces qaidamensis TaxID=1783515 RepID=A0A143BTI5_9ACTN|nr:hypothetical protein A4E84_02275 [Streptomyces qaidamensis]
MRQMGVVVQAAGHPHADRPVLPPLLDAERAGGQPRQGDTRQIIGAGHLAKIDLRSARPADVQAPVVFHELGEFVECAHEPQVVGGTHVMTSFLGVVRRRSARPARVEPAVRLRAVRTAGRG